MNESPDTPAPAPVTGYLPEHPGFGARAIPAIPDYGVSVYSSLPSLAAAAIGTATQGREPISYSAPVIIPSDPFDDNGPPVAFEDLLFQSQVVAAISDSVIALDTDLRVRLINKAAEQMYGLCADQSRGTFALDLIETETDQPYPELLKQVIEQGTWSGRIRQRGAARRWMDVDVTASQIQDDNGIRRGILILSRDVTPLRKAEQEAADRSQFAAAVLESLPGRTCVLDGSGTVIETNRRYREEGPTGAGQSTGPVLGTSYLNWLGEHIDEDELADMRELLLGRCPDFRIEFGFVRRRKRYWTELFAVPLGGRKGGAVVTHVDITARKQAETALTRRATHDPLTGLPNRVLLADRVAQALSRAARTKTEVGLLFCDLDGFRNVNNTHGHLAGDRLLVTIAKRIRAVCRSSDTVARVSGDEFVIILEDVSGRAEVEEVSQRIIDALAEPVLID